MMPFLARRLAAMVIVLAGVSFMIFALLSLAPGSEAAALLGTKPHSPDAIAAITAKYHLDDPFLVQYWHWVTDLLHDDLGQSASQFDQPVTSVVAQRFPVTLELAGLALVIALAVGLPAGFLAGVRQGGFVDRVATVVSTIALTAPAFAVGILLVYVFGVKLSWLPVYGGGSGFLDTLVHLVLPVTTLSVAVIAFVVRLTRAAVRNVMAQDYIAFARARGLSPWRVLVPYAFRNSALPVITTAGLMAIGLITGTVIVEQVFAIQGVGSLLLGAVQSKDIPLAQGVAVLIAVAVVLINLAMDLMTLVLDPRTRHPVGA